MGGNGCLNNGAETITYSYFLMNINTYLTNIDSTCVITINVTDETTKLLGKYLN